VGFDKGVLGDVKRDIAVFLNDGEANFADSSLVILEERTYALKLIDVDNDSDLDIVIGSAAGIFPLRLAINENGSIQSISDITTKNTRVYGIDANDINGDGINDIVASDQVNSTNNLLLLTGGIGTSISDNASAAPETFSLYQNYPNPFNPETNIRYKINKPSQVSLVVFDVLGRKVRILVNEIKQTGSYQIKWNGRSDDGHFSPSGIYIMQFRSRGTQLSRRMLLLK